MEPGSKTAPLALEEVAVAFQKAMARAAQTTARAVADTPAMRYGNRQVYAVQRLEVELCVGAEVQRVEQDGGETERVAVTFDAAPERSARIRFTVDGTPPLEALQDAGLFLLAPRISRAGTAVPPSTALQPGDELVFTAAVHNDTGDPVPAAPVVIELTRLQAEPGDGKPSWTRLPGGLSRLRPVWTDGSGMARFTLTVPPGCGPLLRARARTLLSGAGSSRSLPERKALFLAVEDTAGDLDDAWRAAFLSLEEEAALPAGLRSEDDGYE